MRAQLGHVELLHRGQRADGERHQGGRVRLAAMGIGVRNGASVSASSWPGGATAAASRSCAALLNVTLPAKLHHIAGVRAALGQLGVAGEAVEDHLLRRALLGQDAQHVLVRVPIMDHHRLAGLLGHARCARGTTPAARQSARRPGSGRARSRRPPAPAGSAASSAILPAPAVRRRRPPWPSRSGGSPPPPRRRRRPRCHAPSAGRHVDADRDHPGDAAPRPPASTSATGRASGPGGSGCRRAGRQRRRVGGGRPPYWSRTAVVTGRPVTAAQPGQFLLHDGRVQLGEQRRRRAQSVCPA